MAAALADVPLSVVLHRAVYGLGYLGGQSSGTDGELAPQKGKIWKTEWCDASPEHYQLMEHIWEHMGSSWKGESDWALSLLNCFDFSS